MKVRSYPGRAVLEDPELLLDPEATRGKAMELLYEASWRECSINWANEPRNSSSNLSRDIDETEYKKPYADVISQLENVLDSSNPRIDIPRSQSSSSENTDSECSVIISDNRRKKIQTNQNNGFLIPRPRLIVPVHTYARKRRTGAPAPCKRRQNREGRPEITCQLYYF